MEDLGFDIRQVKVTLTVPTRNQSGVVSSLLYDVIRLSSSYKDQFVLQTANLLQSESYTTCKKVSQTTESSETGVSESSKTGVSESSGSQISNCSIEVKELKACNAQNSKLPFLLCGDDALISRSLADLVNSDIHIYGKNPDERLQIDKWVDWAWTYLKSEPTNQKQLHDLLHQIDQHLYARTVFCCHQLSLADLTIYTLLESQMNRKPIHAIWKNILASQDLKLTTPQMIFKNQTHLSRWFLHLRSIFSKMNPSISQPILTSSNADEDQTKNTDKLTKSQEKAVNIRNTSAQSFEGKLKGAEKGKVVVRFPPEPSGYLHIGHAKAALLNNYYAKLYDGTLIVRFDDTNPVKEKCEFEESILEDLKLLNISATKITHTSDYFDLLITYVEKLIAEGKAYLDNTPLEKMRNERMEGIESECRNQDPSSQLKYWEEMKKGTKIGIEYCVRAKIDMKHLNKCLRDPVLYRCIVDTPHHRHQFKYKVYPTYDFACPIVDSLEGVTHAMRTNEYADRIPQYNWVIEACALRKVTIYEFSRLNFVRTVLSKRLLTWFVTNKVVTGWDDPRFPTVRGILRRGMTSEALLAFILEQGPSRASNLMEWDKLWTKNKQFIDDKAPRYFAVAEDCVKVEISGLKNEVEVVTRDLHPKNSALGQVPIFHTKNVLIEREDANLCSEKEEITLMKWGNIIIDKIERSSDSNESIKCIYATIHLEGDFKKTKKKLHWLPDLQDQITPCLLREYDHLINVDKFDPSAPDWQNYVQPVTQYDTPALADPLVKTLNKGDRVQFERRGYFIVDSIHWPREHEFQPMVLIKIPDGKSKAISTLSTKVDAATLAGTKKRS